MSSGSTGTVPSPSGTSGLTGGSSGTASIFALTPAQAVTGPINYRTLEGQKLYKSTTVALTDDGFGLDAANLKVFLETLMDQAFEHDFLSILEVPEDTNDPNSPKHNVISHYGKVNLAEIEMHAKTYVSLQT